MASKSIEIEFKATGNVEEALKRQGLSADQTARKLKELNSVPQAKRGSGNRPSNGGGEDESEGGLKGVADSLGSRRLLSRIVGGGIAGFAGSELANFSGKLAEVTAQFRAGQIDAKGMVVAIGEGLPILGGFVTAGQNIREIFTHEKADIEKINEENKLQNQVIEYRQTLLEGEKKRTREIADIMHGITQRRGKIGLEGFDAEEYDRRAGAENRGRDLENKKQAEIDASDAAAKKQLDSIGDQARQGKLSNEKYHAASIAIEKAHSKDVADIKSKFQGAELNEFFTSQSELNAADQKAANESAKVTQENEARLKGIRDQARADQFRSLGRDGDAEVVEIQRQADEKKAAIAKSAQEQIKAAFPTYRAQIAKQAQNEIAAVDADAAQKRADTQRKHQLDIDNKLKGQRTASLEDRVTEAQGFSNKLQAKRDLEAQKIKDEFQDRARELGKILNDPFATEKEKSTARGQLQDFAAQANKKFDAATGEQAPQSQALSSLSVGNTLTGVGETSRDHLRDNANAALETAKNSKEGVEVQKQMLAAFNAFVQMQQHGGNTQNYTVGAGIN